MFHTCKAGAAASSRQRPVEDPAAVLISPDPHRAPSDTAQPISAETQTLLKQTFGSWAMKPSDDSVVHVDSSPITAILGKPVEHFTTFLSGTWQERDRALRLLLGSPLEYEARMWILTSGGVSALINYAAESAEARPDSQKLAIRTLFGITIRLIKVSAYPTDLNNSHFEKLAYLLVRQPDCLFYVLWTILELTKYPQGRRSAVDANIPEVVGRIVVANVGNRAIIAALYVLLDLAGDEICSEALIKLDLFTKFRTAIRACFVRRFLKAEAALPAAALGEDRIFMWAFAQSNDDERMRVNDTKLVASYWRLYAGLPGEWLEQVEYWVRLVLTLIRHNVVVQHATIQRQPIFEALELVLIFANEESLIELVRILSVYVRASNSHALNWIFKGNVVDTMLSRFPWRLYQTSSPSTQCLLEELLVLIGHILDVIPSKTCARDDRLRQKLYGLFDEVFKMKWPKHVDQTVFNISRQANRLFLPGGSSVIQAREGECARFPVPREKAGNGETPAPDTDVKK